MPVSKKYSAMACVLIGLLGRSKKGYIQISIKLLCPLNNAPNIRRLQGVASVCVSPGKGGVASEHHGLVWPLSVPVKKRWLLNASR